MAETIAKRMTGMSRWIDFARSTVALGTVITLGLWTILTYALDERYASLDDVEGLAAQQAEIRRDVADVRKRVDKIAVDIADFRSSRLEEQIIVAQERLCKSTDYETRQYFQGLLHDLSEQYRSEQDQDPFIPMCQDAEP